MTHKLEIFRAFERPVIWEDLGMCNGCLKQQSTLFIPAKLNYFRSGINKFEIVSLKNFFLYLRFSKIYVSVLEGGGGDGNLEKKFQVTNVKNW